MNDDVGDFGAHVDERLGARTELVPGRTRRTDQGERRQVSLRGPETGGLDRLDGLSDHLGCGGDQQNAQGPALAVPELLQNVEVEVRFIDRHRDVVLHLESDRLLQVGGGHPRQVELAHDDLAVRDPDDHVFALEAALRPEGFEGDSECVGVLDLAAFDHASVKRQLCVAVQDEGVFAP